MSDEMEVGRRLAHLERELASHGQGIVMATTAAQSVERASGERLEYLKERFDAVEARMERADSSSKFWTTTALTILFTAAVSVNYMYIEPVIEKVQGLERRLMYVEKELSRIIPMSDPE
jgi:predicted MFS family arabinose efflux permease